MESRRECRRDPIRSNYKTRSYYQWLTKLNDWPLHLNKHQAPYWDYNLLKRKYWRYYLFDRSCACAWELRYSFLKTWSEESFLPIAFRGSKTWGISRCQNYLCRSARMSPPKERTTMKYIQSGWLCGDWRTQSDSGLANAMHGNYWSLACTHTCWPNSITSITSLYMRSFFRSLLGRRLQSHLMFLNQHISYNLTCIKLHKSSFSPQSQQNDWQCDEVNQKL